MNEPKEENRTCWCCGARNGFSYGIYTGCSHYPMNDDQAAYNAARKKEFSENMQLIAAYAKRKRLV